MMDHRISFRLGRSMMIVGNPVFLAGAALTFGNAAQGQIQLTESSLASGLGSLHGPDQTCIGSQAWQTGGLAVGDFDRDGWPDIFVVGGGIYADRLFINNGDGTFTDRAAQWGVRVFHGGNGAAVGDYDKDGWLDLYVSSFGIAGAPGQPGMNRLYHNNGNGTFTNVAQQAGVAFTATQVANGYGAAWGDYNLDGKLDLFVAAWKDMRGLGNFGSGNRLYKNMGNGTFAHVTSQALGNAMFGVWGFQPAFTDMDGDGWPELLLAADFRTSRYLRNNGNGTFFNMTVGSGTGLDDNGMGQTIADFNLDGRLDWYVTSIFKDFPQQGDNPGNMLYMNQGNHLYLEQSHVAGVNDGGWGWGTTAVDLDQDGWEDIIEVNGRPAPGGEWETERGYLWRNNGDGTFTEMGVQAGFEFYGEGRALAWLDTDRDGDLDIVQVVNNGQLLYYRNDTPKVGYWLMIALDTSTNARMAADGFGSLVKITAGGSTQQRYISGSPSYLATSELAAHFGLGAATLVDELVIQWPRGYVTTMHNVPVNQHITVQAPRPSDINGDGVVNFDDVLAIIENWGACPVASMCTPDVTGNGSVNFDDVLAAIMDWG